MLRVFSTAFIGKLAELTFVGTLPQLLVVRSLLYDVQNGVGQLHKHTRLSKLNGIELAPNPQASAAIVLTVASASG